MITLKKQAWWKEDNWCCQAISALCERGEGHTVRGMALYMKHFIKCSGIKILWEKSRPVEPLSAEILCSNKNIVLRLCYQTPAQTCNSAQKMWNESREAANSRQAATVGGFNRGPIEIGLLSHQDRRQKRCVQMCKVAASQNTCCMLKDAFLNMVWSGALDLLGN